MSILIEGVIPESPADKRKIRGGDRLVSVNGHEITDVLDYDFYTAEERIRLTLERGDTGRKRTVRLKKGEYEPLGLTFENFLMDKQHHCRNKCIFCFVDQMPPGLRESLYFKDDDTRLSFLFGNYVTLTNLDDKEIDRIITMHISPINVSVHTTNPELRVAMMKHKRAGEVLSYLPKLAAAGISLNCQLVLCPGINDGGELLRSLNDLAKLYPAVQSIACVPVGLTKYRDGLPEISPYTKEQAAAVIDAVEHFAHAFQAEHGTRLAYPADEFYIKAGRPLPGEDDYEEYPQLENGVGLITSLQTEFRAALAELPEKDTPRRVTLATGVDAAPYIRELAEELKTKRKNLVCNVIPVKNRFFGETITVAGLLTGQDILAALEGLDLGDALLLPSCVLRHEQDRFLDDMTFDFFREKIPVPILLCENEGSALLSALTGEEVI